MAMAPSRDLTRQPTILLWAARQQQYHAGSIRVARRWVAEPGRSAGAVRGSRGTRLHWSSPRPRSRKNTGRAGRHQATGRGPLRVPLIGIRRSPRQGSRPSNKLVGVVREPPSPALRPTDSRRVCRTAICGCPRPSRPASDVAPCPPRGRGLRRGALPFPRTSV